MTPPRFDWLWHLAALNVVKVDFGPIPGVLPAQDQTAARSQPAPAISSTVWGPIPKTGQAYTTAARIVIGVSRALPI
jgi:hypothetical protein